MKSISQAILLSWKYLILTLTLIGGLWLLLYLRNFTIDLDILKIYIAPKVVLTSILMASLIFYQRFVWEDIESVELTEYSKVVKYFSFTVSLLFVAVILLIFSIAADSYILIIDSLDWVVTLSLVCSTIALLYLFLFVAWLAIRTLGEMQTLREAGEGKTLKEPAKNITKDQGINMADLKKGEGDKNFTYPISEERQLLPQRLMVFLLGNSILVLGFSEIVSKSKFLSYVISSLGLVFSLIGLIHFCRLPKRLNAMEGIKHNWKRFLASWKQGRGIGIPCSILFIIFWGLVLVGMWFGWIVVN